MSVNVLPLRTYRKSAKESRFSFKTMVRGGIPTWGMGAWKSFFFIIASSKGPSASFKMR